LGFYVERSFSGFGFFAEISQARAALQQQQRSSVGKEAGDAMLRV
jgi:hypothetical protein